MPIHKQHLEFAAIDLDSGWATPEGYPAGIEQKILSGVLDEAACTGIRTRLLRFKPGAYSTTPFLHNYWEEVYLLSGDLLVGTDGNASGWTAFVPNTYACRPPGVEHGPFKSEQGCLLLEMHFYDEIVSA
jgi:hypothetical protein